jgi:beta-1,4-mannosyl-glycoprotein beta-1,4-N-acetylglucosaminyltransferase
MKIIDCFIFYNELDLLKYRLCILNDYVDFFVLVESRHTHTGKEKELIYENNKHLFEEFHSKLIHIIVEDFPYKYPNVNFHLSQQWINENHQRNQIALGLNKIELVDEDVIIITDLDEIIDRKILEQVKNNEIKINIQMLSMDMYYCNLNHKKGYTWTDYPKILSYETYKNLAKTCTEIRLHNSGVVIPNAGWHLSYFGDSHFIKNKIENFGHQELNHEHFTNIDNITRRVENFTDIYDRNEVAIKISVKDNDRLPYEYEKYLQKFVLF